MEKGYLSDYFETFAFKRLSAVEADAFRSNQHEFNGTSDFKKILGKEKKSFNTTFMYLSDNDETRLVKSTGILTWYDSRERHPTRSEFRLYYQTNPSLSLARENDFLVLCKIDCNNLVVLVARKGSTVESQLCWLLNIEATRLSGQFRIQTPKKSSSYELSFLGKLILEELGLDVSSSFIEDAYYEELKNTFPDGFPTTKIFSSFARKHSGLLNSIDDPDNTILHWMEHEEVLFRTFEKVLIEQKISSGFDVEDFLSFSLSVQNRRKARAGLAFENHLQQIFKDHKVRHSFNKKTELKSKPDFIFPGIDEYHDLNYPEEMLYMLAVKTSCKDRWRQVLAEAQRISRKHLITLEPGISQDQTDEMQAKNLQLVLPKGIFSSYNASQQSYIISLADFVDIVKKVS